MVDIIARSTTLLAGITIPPADCFLILCLLPKGKSEVVVCILVVSHYVSSLCNVSSRLIPGYLPVVTPSRYSSIRPPISSTICCISGSFSISPGLFSFIIYTLCRCGCLSLDIFRGCSLSNHKPLVSALNKQFVLWLGDEDGNNLGATLRVWVIDVFH